MYLEGVVSKNMDSNEMMMAFTDKWASEYDLGFGIVGDDIWNYP